MTEHTMIFQSKAAALSQAVSQSNLSEFAQQTALREHHTKMACTAKSLNTTPAVWVSLRISKGSAATASYRKVYRF